MTDAERAMWLVLKSCAPEARWRKQVPIRHFIVDLASHRLKLVVEVDGGQHSEEVDAAPEVTELVCDPVIVRADGTDVVEVRAALAPVEADDAPQVRRL